MKKILNLVLIFFISLSLLACEMSNETNIDTDSKDEQSLNLIKKQFTMYQIMTKHSEMNECDYEYLYFGSYPQHEITDQNIVSQLEKLKENSQGYIEYRNRLFVKFTVEYNFQHVSQGQEGDEVFYETTGFWPNTTHYFIVEPICWLVLKNDNGTLTLISEEILNSRQFNSHTETRVIDGKEIYPSNYGYSDIREWLNNDFYNIAFTSKEKEMIQEVTNSNKCLSNFLTSIEEAEDTQDLVYLASYQDVTNREYGFLKDPICDASRLCHATDFALAHGLINHKYGEYYTSVWALRNAHEFIREYMSDVAEDGRATDYFFVDSPNIGTRPMMTIILK
mgnify:CR=1 FL=1